MGLLRFTIICLLALIALPNVDAQSASYSGLLTQRVKSGKLSPPAHVQDYVVAGKLRLRLQDAILLALENNSNIRIQETTVESQKFALLGAYRPFDPQFQSIANANRYSYSSYTQLQGVGDNSNPTLNQLSQSVQASYTQTFITGTNIFASLTSSRTSTNSAFYFLNPYVNSTVLLQFTQPLIRNFGRFANTAPILIARRSLEQSRAGFEAQVNDAILEVITEYWTVVQARGNFDVEQKSLALAESSFKHDQRALELGALPPLDIYRSQSEVASRRVQSIQSEYALKQAQEALRFTIGVDQDPALAALDLDLVEKPDPEGAIETIDAEEVMRKALSARPEIAAANAALAGDETSIKYAHNALRPDLSVTGFYQSNGVGGNEYNLNTGALVSTGGLGASFNQMFGFGFPGYGGTLTLNLPIRNRGAQANLGSALVTRRRDLYSSQVTREQIVREVKDAIHLLEEAKLNLAAGKTSLDLAQKSLAADQRKYELGAETNFFVLDSQTRLAQSELDLLRTQISYQIARATVDRATGSLLEPYHVQIAELSQ
jgi:HAE1 family hydrophobic/amphiphilic exporter-1